ncbi:hypothetical protein EHS25_008238 [Saitozyma podzolica]|uniref:Major facilitator superfamily (MFS) profile domain-containing protein n=1 Tax=Saitozyma podzolica TaxID=1890683 RepID=A0A427YNT6_9TREE|nr:hypothetical protein EHS25_008238 [Saitozyma podzolica]
MRSTLLHGRTLQVFQTGMCCMGFLLLGYDQGVMSGIIGATNQFGKDFDAPSTTLQGVITSIYDIGCAVGALITFAIGEKVGRRHMILMGGTIMIIGPALLGSSTTLAQLLVGRIVTGLGNGFNCSSIPTYQAETCPPRIRGALVCLQSTLTIVGLVVAYYIDIGFSYIDGPIQWRFPISFQAFFAIWLVIMVLFVPDTPRWLLESGRNDDATRVLAAMAGEDVSCARIVAQRDDILRSLEAERLAAGPGEFHIKELFQGGKTGNWRRVGLSCAVLVMQQATGANMINYYAPTVYENAIGVSREVSLQLGGGTSLTYLAASFICLFTVDRFGRRQLMMFASAGLAFCFYMTAILVAVSETRTGEQAKSLGAAGAAFVFLFQVFLGIGWLGIPFLYPTEVSTTGIRSKAAALGTFCNWMAVFIVVMITPTAVTNIGWRVFLIFGSFNLAFIPIVYCLFPETSNLTLEEVDRMFEKGGLTGGVFTSKGGRTVEPGSGDGTGRRTRLDDGEGDLRVDEPKAGTETAPAVQVDA